MGIGYLFSAFGVTERSYSTSEVWGSSRECQAGTAQEWPRGATLHPWSGVMAKRSYPASEARSGARGKGRCLRPGEAAERSNPMSKEWWLHWRRRA